MHHLDGGCLCASCLGGSEVAEDMQHGGIDSSGVVEELADDSLEGFGFIGGVAGRVVDWIG